MFGHDSNQIVIDAIIELAEAAQRTACYRTGGTRSTTRQRQTHEAIREDLQEAYKVADKVASRLVQTAKKKD